MSRPYRNEGLSSATTERTYLRTVISRFGGIIKVGTSVQIPPQTWEDPKPGVVQALSFRKRVPPEFEIVTAGVPGYAGHLPNGSVPHPDYTSMRGANSNHSKRHDRWAYDRSLQPTRMPIVGFSGHMRGTKESLECYGTSHWRPRPPSTKAAQKAVAHDAARRLSLDMANATNLYRRPHDLAANNRDDPLLQA